MQKDTGVWIWDFKNEQGNLHRGEKNKCVLAYAKTMRHREEF